MSEALKTLAAQVVFFVVLFGAVKMLTTLH